MTDLAIRTADLGRTYKVARAHGASADGQPTPDTFTALDGVNLEVRRGELFGLLGSNGAGKTTLIKILTTLLAPTRGRAWVDGLDVVTQAAAIRPRINMVSGGETSGYGVLTVRENLWLFCQLYGVPRAECKDRIDYLLRELQLTEKANTRISHLSTGLRQKMNFCRGFVTDPKILYLDEPTLGLDVTAARTVRKFVRNWMDEREGRTMVLTTHYLAEAEELCDRIAIIHRGKLLACDTPRALKQKVQRYPVFEMAVAAPTAGSNGYHHLDRLPGVKHCSFVEGATRVDIKLSLDEESVVGPVVQELIGGGSRIISLKKVEPSLEEVFVQLVGRGAAVPAEATA
jgi:ABC-2 type transport system ATP-binding protein